ncbi:hypothetical protein AB204_20555 [Xenorhabdus khoisanae]|uniref:Fumarase D n=1 Tax=Xenorhabdus khoisanae TaxID=880157 RepID=A0A0J5FM31_9GAMM|nr:hypothetical protein [Xenorhabdus khoisanae]KMJ43286.1 hypothetical protein AB204_20555 [Xenorhabdus khoisanae]
MSEKIFNDVGAYALIGRAVCQLLEKNSPVCETDIASIMSDIFLAEYQGSHDSRCEAFNGAVKLLTDIKKQP